MYNIKKGYRKMKTLVKNLIKNLRHAELDSASQIDPHPSFGHPLPEVEGKKWAFTLAETLITLGVIGVVAAIVMPGVINDFKVKQLKAQFETADSIITQALQHTVRELGYEKPTDLNLPLSYPSSSQNMILI